MFGSAWFDTKLAAQDLPVFELFPWHSTAVTGSMHPPMDVVQNFIWDPISELDAEWIFAFGKPWSIVPNDLEPPLIASLGNGGEPYGSLVASRTIRVHQLPSGPRLLIHRHSASGFPPSAVETQLLHRAVAHLG